MNILHFRASSTAWTRLLCSRSRYVVIRVSFVSFVSAADTTCQRRHVEHVFRCAPGNRSADKYCLQLVQYRPIVAIVIVVDVVARTRLAKCLVDRRRPSSTSYPPTSPLSRLARGRRAHRQSLRTLESRVASIWSRKVSTGRLVDGASSRPPVPSFSRARPHRHPFRRRSRARVQRPLCIKRETPSSLARGVLSTASSCARDASPHLKEEFEALI